MIETLSECFESLSCPARHERGSKRLRAVPSLDQFPRNNTFDSGVRQQVTESRETCSCVAAEDTPGV